MGGLRGYLCFLRTFYTLGDGVVTFNFYATANVKGFDVYSLYPRQNGARIVSHLPGDLDWLRSLDLAMCGLKPSLNRLQAPGKFDDSILNWRKACAEKYGFAYRQLLFPREPLSWIWNIRPLPCGAGGGLCPDALLCQSGIDDARAAALHAGTADRRLRSRRLL